MTNQIDFDDLNDMSSSEFVAALADVFEHSPWIAEHVVEHRPIHLDP